MTTCAKSAVRRPDSTTARPARANMLQRAAVKSACQCAECAKGNGLLRRAAVTEHAPPAVPPIVYDVLRSPGAPLERGTRAFMEERFGHDFSAVRVHTDARAAESARAVNARAYTVGSHVVFGDGEYHPGGQTGSRLLAHELVHVVQQRGLNHSGSGLASINTMNAEREANDAMHMIDVMNMQNIIPIRQMTSVLTLQKFPAKQRAEPDEGSCWTGSGLTAQAVGDLAHAAIQADLYNRGFTDEAIIPRSLTDMRGRRPDLIGLWTEREARVLGLPVQRTGPSPWVLAEIGEIKPRSYSVGGPRRFEATARMQQYLAEWRRFSPYIPAMPLRSVTWGVVEPFVAGKRIDTLVYYNSGDGILIYSCVGGPEPKFQPAPALERARQTVKGEDSKSHPAGVELPLGVRALVLLFVLQARLIKSEIDLAKAALKFVSEHARELALLAGLTIAVLLASFPPGWIPLAIATALVAAVNSAAPRGAISTSRT